MSQWRGWAAARSWRGSELLASEQSLNDQSPGAGVAVTVAPDCVYVDDPRQRLDLFADPTPHTALNVLDAVRFYSAPETRRALHRFFIESSADDLARITPDAARRLDAAFLAPNDMSAIRRLGFVDSNFVYLNQLGHVVICDTVAAQDRLERALAADLVHTLYGSPLLTTVPLDVARRVWIKLSRGALPADMPSPVAPALTELDAPLPATLAVGDTIVRRPQLFAADGRLLCVRTPETVVSVRVRTPSGAVIDTFERDIVGSVVDVVDDLDACIDESDSGGVAVDSDSDGDFVCDVSSSSPSASDCSVSEDATGGGAERETMEADVEVVAAVGGGDPVVAGASTVLENERLSFSVTFKVAGTFDVQMLVNHQVVVSSAVDVV